eukprot:g5012.t1
MAGARVTTLQKSQNYALHLLNRHRASGDNTTRTLFSLYILSVIQHRNLDPPSFSKVKHQNVHSSPNNCVYPAAEDSLLTSSANNYLSRALIESEKKKTQKETVLLTAYDMFHTMHLKDVI